MIIRDATKEDVLNFKLRQEEQKEFWRTARMTGQEMLEQCWKYSRECRVVEQDGKIFCLFGCVPEGEGACVWILFTEIESLPLSFFKISKTYIKGLLKTYKYLWNYGSAENVFILKWSEMLKFTISEPEPYGVDGLSYKKFYIGRDA